MDMTTNMYMQSQPCAVISLSKQSSFIISSLYSQLPQPIINHILSFAMSPQDPILLNDIRHFQQSKKKMLDFHRNIWIEQFAYEEPEDKYWVINNLFSFFGEFEHKHHLYNNQFFAHSLDTQINILWSRISVTEREEFIYAYDVEDNVEL